MTAEKLQFRFKFDSAADSELKNRSVLVCEVMEDCHIKSFSAISLDSENKETKKVIPLCGSPIPGGNISILTKQDINIIDKCLDVVGSG